MCIPVRMDFAEDPHHRLIRKKRGGSIMIKGRSRTVEAPLWSDFLWSGHKLPGLKKRQHQSQTPEAGGGGPVDPPAPTGSQRSGSAPLPTGSHDSGISPGRNSSRSTGLGTCSCGESRRGLAHAVGGATPTSRPQSSPPSGQRINATSVHTASPITSPPRSTRGTAPPAAGASPRGGGSQRGSMAGSRPTRPSLPGSLRARFSRRSSH